MNIASGKVTDCGLAVLQYKVAQLNKRAARLGIVPMTVTVTGNEYIKTTHECGLDYEIRLHLVDVTGEAPRINGWAVAARIEFTEAGNFVVTAPGVEDLDHKWRTIKNVCEHCNTNRKRNELVAIRHEDGREIVVGRNCLADYIRTGDAESLLAWASMMTFTFEASAEEEKEYWGGGYGDTSESLENILRFSSLCIRKLGWVSGKVAEECQKTSTATNVRCLMYPPRDSGAKADWKKWIAKYELYATEFDTEEAAKALAWMQSLPLTDSSEYCYNLRIVANLGYVPNNKVNLVVSAVASAKRARDEEVKRAEFGKKNANKAFMGAVKERLRNLEVTVKRTHSFDGMFGVTTIITLACGDNELTWFASGDRTEEYKQGSTYTIDATVKEHKDDPKYGKSTVVNRVAESKPPKEKKAKKAKADQAA